MGKLMHLALIMDGNGRWAERRGLSRSEGHKEGARVACRVAKAASDRGIGYLTLYCFSTENWKRPKGEVDSLMGLFSSELETMIGRLVENGIRVLHLGRRDRLPEMVLRRLDRVVSETSGMTGMTLQLAIDYGGEDEIQRCIARAMRNGEKELSVPVLSRYVDNPSIPYPDFICRSSARRITSYSFCPAAPAAAAGVSCKSRSRMSLTGR